MTVNTRILFVPKRNRLIIDDLVLIAGGIDYYIPTNNHVFQLDGNALAFCQCLADMPQGANPYDHFFAVDEEFLKNTQNIVWNPSEKFDRCHEAQTSLFVDNNDVLICTPTAKYRYQKDFPDIPVLCENFRPVRHHGKLLANIDGILFYQSPSGKKLHIVGVRLGNQCSQRVIPLEFPTDIRFIQAQGDGFIIWYAGKSAAFHNHALYYSWSKNNVIHLTRHLYDSGFVNFLSGSWNFRMGESYGDSMYLHTHIFPMGSRQNSVFLAGNGHIGNTNGYEWKVGIYTVSNDPDLLDNPFDFKKVGTPIVNRHQDKIRDFVKSLGQEGTPPILLLESER